MEYRQGSVGRVFIVKIEHGDDPLAEIVGLAVKEDIPSAMFTVIGALQKADLVVGPREDVVPPDPVWRSFNSAHEILGIGTIFRNEQDEPSIHLHSSVGRGDESITGCIRTKAETYLVLEVIILEITGIYARRNFDPVSALHMLGFR